MRPIIDKLVKDEYENRPLQRQEFMDKLRQYPGSVQQLNNCAFVSYKSIKVDSIMRLIDASKRMPGETEQQKYCLAILSYANLGSIYLSIATQYALYKILTPEVNPMSVKEYLSTGGQAHLVSSLDFKVLDKMIDDIMQGYKLCGEIKSELGDIAAHISD